MNKGGSPGRSSGLSRHPSQGDPEDRRRYHKKIGVNQRGESAGVYCCNRSGPQEQEKDQGDSVARKKTGPDPGSGKGEKRETGAHAQGKKKPPIKGRTEFQQAVHHLLVRDYEISGLIYDREGPKKGSVGEIDLEGGDDLSGKEPGKDGRGRITDGPQSTEG